jgi:hypothetical protein
MKPLLLVAISGSCTIAMIGALAGIAGCAKGADAAAVVDQVDLIEPGDGGSPAPSRPLFDAGVDDSAPPAMPAPAGCDAGRADCNKNAADGCETDLQNDSSNCSACGSACAQPANSTASCALGTCGFACWGGFTKLGNQCANFGGAYAVSDPGCPSCATPDAIGGACGCPAGFAASVTARLINDCSGLHGAQLAFCTAPGTAGSGDWAGAYELDDAVACSLGCRAPNPNTGACSCPAGATPIALRTLVDGSCAGDLHGATLTLCLNQAVPTTTFGGAYQKDDAVPGGSGCRVANPKTSACSCPAGTTARDYRTVADSAAGTLGTLLSICIP